MDLCPSPRQQELIDLAHRLAIDNFAPRAAQYDREASFPFADYDDLRAAGLLASLCTGAVRGPGRDFRDVLPGRGAHRARQCLHGPHL